MRSISRIRYAGIRRLAHRARWSVLLLALFVAGMINRSPEETASDAIVADTVATTSEGIDSVNHLIRRALSLQGVPYVYGGKTQAGFDCSGFAQYVYRGIDVQLPGSSRAQYSVGTAVPLEEAQRGDLVFFSIDASRINHVGIVLNNDETETTFVHATTSRGVRVDQLANPYYATHFVGVRSVLGD